MLLLTPDIQPLASNFLMSQVKLAFGNSAFEFVFDEARFSVLTKEIDGERALSDAEIAVAFDHPFDAQPLEEIISAGESALIVVGGATRRQASAAIVNMLVRRLVELGIAAGDIHIIIANANTRAATIDEKRALLTPFIMQRVRVLEHDARDENQLARLGETERGTPIELNRALIEHSHVFLIGSIEFDALLGFTGGRELICPGLASIHAIEEIERLAFDFGKPRAGVGFGLLDGNSAHEECERFAAEVAPSFVVNIFADERDNATKIHVGDWRASHRLACAEYSDAHTLQIDAKREMVIAGCGGAPYDRNLLAAVRTLEIASRACVDGSAIILVAECAEGFGVETIDEYASKTLRDLTQHFRVHLVSKLSVEDARGANLNVSRTLDDALAQVDKNSLAYILPHGAKFLPVTQS